jgi:hypothetical protein
MVNMPIEVTYEKRRHRRWQVPLVWNRAQGSAQICFDSIELGQRTINGSAPFIGVELNAV